MPIITFIEPDGRRRECDAADGETILDVGQRFGIDLEGSCEGCMACSTCHVIVSEDWFSKLEVASEEEDDMLDMAYDLTKTSRLGCQVVLNDGLDGIVVGLPSAHHNLMD
ncbi:MAG TPA: 2Fe-2S iron-sulfur cluster binding domain-containing protein [Rhodospirillales bacterium]|nr:2Fe-2S iron-sulfur cluster binding domain-containing protein [Rhodospirillales bacterium]